MDHKRRICIIVCAVMAIGCSRDPKRNTKRPIWQKNWLAEREKYGHISLLRELRENNPYDFKNYIRLDRETFGELLNLMRPHHSKQDTSMRRGIPADEQLIATLRFFATGRSYDDIKFTTGISAQAFGHIIPETYQDLYKVLHKDYLKLPSSKEGWTNVSRGFNSRRQMLNYGGATNGKHIRIVLPSDALYYNYKNFYGIVLMTTVNAHYEFVYVDVAKNGRMLDGGVLEHTTFFTHLTSDRLNLPEYRMQFKFKLRVYRK